MASHKNQHFVSRCYLRPFSLDGRGVAINLYNIDRMKSIPAAAVKGQCSRSYFYGEDLIIETLLQKSEALYAGALRQIVEPSYALLDSEKIILRHFSLLQYSRTAADIKTSTEQSKSVYFAGLPMLSNALETFHRGRRPWPLGGGGATRSCDQHISTYRTAEMPAGLEDDFDARSTNQRFS